MKQLHIRITDDQHNFIDEALGVFHQLNGVACSKQNLMTLIISRGLASLQKEYQEKLDQQE